MSINHAVGAFEGSRMEYTNRMIPSLVLVESRLFYIKAVMFFPAKRMREVEI